MYVQFARERFWEVQIDGEHIRVEGVSDRNSALKKVYEERISCPLRRLAEAEMAQWDRQLADLRAATVSRTETRKRGSLGSRVSYEMAILTFPDGRTAECAAPDVDRRILQEMQARSGARPSLPVPRVPNDIVFEWAEPQGVTAVEVRRWSGWACEPDGSIQELALDGSTPFQAIPFSEVTIILNRYSALGWSVISVSEDKGLYAGVDAKSEAYPTRMRFLLSR